MPISVFSLNAAVSQGFTTADNGLTASTPTNVQLGGTLIKNTVINLGTFLYYLGAATANLQIQPGANPTFQVATQTGTKSAVLALLNNSLQLAAVNNGNSFGILLDPLGGGGVLDNINNIGLVNQADYSAAIIGNGNALTSTLAVQQLINAVFNPALYALVAGQIFTGNISAPNLSGTNTGDQNLTPYALLASPTFTGTPAAPTAAPGTNTTQLATTAFIEAVKALCALLSGATFTGAISATNLSGTNTGDQNLTPYALLAGASFSGAVSAPKSVNTIISANFIGIIATQVIFSVTSAAAVTVYRVNLFYQITAYTAGSGTLVITYTDINGTVTNTTVTVGNSVGDAGLSPRIFAAKASTPISATLTIAGGAQIASIGGSLELLY